MVGEADEAVGVLEAGAATLVEAVGCAADDDDEAEDAVSLDMITMTNDKADEH